MDADKMYGEKTWRKLDKNAMSYIEPTLAAASYKTTAILPPTSYL